MAKEKMTVLAVEPGKEPYVQEISGTLESLQKEVGGDIAIIIGIHIFHFFCTFKKL